MSRFSFILCGECVRPAARKCQRQEAATQPMVLLRDRPNRKLNAVLERRLPSNGVHDDVTSVSCSPDGSRFSPNRFSFRGRFPRSLHVVVFGTSGHRPSQILLQSAPTAELVQGHWSPVSFSSPRFPLNAACVLHRPLGLWVSWDLKPHRHLSNATDQRHVSTGRKCGA